ncbi:hypothetical protein [Altererythrobacter aquiaggeris]|uniref:hypothetical protein n=1 Tax=Aestuarierythrobacter aquiaggeris TaxID=1898396 RepID=UPI003017BF1E
MNYVVAMLAPLALLIPWHPAGHTDGPDGGSDRALSMDQAATGTAAAPAWRIFAEVLRAPGQSQVRIERRVTIRISPRVADRRNSLLAETAIRDLGPAYEARKTGDCLDLDRIGAVQVDRENRLLLFMRDKQIIRANLNKKCNARDFYSGFYVDREADGKLCISRDRLKSRVGTSCEVRKFRTLVPAGT